MLLHILAESQSLRRVYVFTRAPDINLAGQRDFPSPFGRAAGLSEPGLLRYLPCKILRAYRTCPSLARPPSGDGFSARLCLRGAASASIFTPPISAPKDFGCYPILGLSMRLVGDRPPQN
jgi:hypothetical protein